jgi:hypothetical protein
MAEIYLHPIFYVLMLAVAVAIVVLIPWLQKKADETETVLDNKIVTLLKVKLDALVALILKRHK